MNAIVLANALVYTSPSSDRGSVASKQRSWDKFINSLDWGNLTKGKKKMEVKDVLSVFQKVGMVPILKKKKE
jgi:hypothetical protein